MGFRWCLEIWAVIGRHGSWGLSWLCSHWSEQIYSTGVQRKDYSINVQQYNWSEHSVCTTSVCLVVVQYICTGIYIYKVQCLCVCVYPVYMSCVYRRTVHQYKLCIAVQYICTWIYIYKPIRPWVCPVYMSCTFYIDVVFVDGRGPFRCPEIWNFLVKGDTNHAGNTYHVFVNYMSLCRSFFT
jgi:hypothetical protein